MKSWTVLPVWANAKQKPSEQPQTEEPRARDVGQSVKTFLWEHLKIYLFIFRSNRTSSEVLREIQDNINGEGVTMIEVGRSTVWEDVCDKLGQKSFSPNNRLLVKFVDKEGESEEAIDLGGPKRELLRLAVKDANEKSNIFFGPPRCRSLFANTTGMRLSFIYDYLAIG